MSKNAGFTLIEILIAVALVGIIGFTSVGLFSSAFSDIFCNQERETLISILGRTRLSAMLKNRDYEVKIIGNAYTIFGGEFEEIVGKVSNLHVSGLPVTFLSGTGSVIGSTSISINGSVSTCQRNIFISDEGTIFW